MSNIINLPLYRNFNCIIILCIFKINFFYVSFPVLAQKQDFPIRSINKYFNRDLTVDIFSKMQKLSKKLSQNKPTAGRKIDRDKDIWVIRVDGNSEPFPLTIDKKYDDEMPIWSPDDQYIAYVSTRSGKKKIWKMNSEDGTNKTQLTKGTAPDSYPLWSPDGSQIAFIRNEKLFVVEISSRKERQITKNVKFQVERLCAWSRDGKSVLLKIKDVLKLIIIDLDSNIIRDAKLPAGLYTLWNKLQLCPDKDYVVFESFEIDNYSITIGNLTNEKQWKLTSSYSHDRHPKWSNKGDLIVFSSNRKTPDFFDIQR